MNADILKSDQLRSQWRVLACLILLYFLFFELHYRIFYPDIYTFKVNLVSSLGYQDVLVVCLVLFVGMRMMGKMRKVVLTKWFVGTSTFVLCYFVASYPTVVESPYLNELRTCLWFVGGIGLCMLMIESRRFHLMLACLIIVCASILLEATILHPGFDRFFGVIDRVQRITSPNMYFLSYMLLTPCSIALAYVAKRHRYHLVVVLFGLLVYLLTVGILGATRSNVVFLVTLVISSGAAFLSKANGVDHSAESVSKRTFGLVGAIGIVVILMSLNRDLLLSQSSLVGRFGEEDMASSRLYEVELLFRNSDIGTIVLGRGIAGTVVENQFVLAGLHIAIFTVLSHFGAIPFLVVSGFLYVVVPLRLVGALRRTTRLDVNERTAILATYPALLVHANVMAMSGGYHESSFLGLGVVYMLYRYIKVHGALDGDERWQHGPIHRLTWSRNTQTPWNIGPRL